MIELFHLALADDWAAARVAGSYRVSTLGQTLDDVGFIHLSFAHQVRGTAERFYAGRDDLVLLCLDAARLSSPVRLERVGEHRFPHLYGPFTPAEVLDALPYPRDAGGRFTPVG